MTSYLRQGRYKLLISVTLAVFLMLTGNLSAVENGTKLKTGFTGIDFSNGFLKVSVEKQAFKDVIEEVARKTGTRIVTSSPIDEEMTVSFDYLPLEKALQQLLSGKSHVFFYSSQAGNQVKLSQVFILPGSPGTSTTSYKDTIRNHQVRELTAGKTQFPNQREIDEMFKNISMNDPEIKKQLYQAIEDLQNNNGFKDTSQIENEISRQTEEAIKILEAIPTIEIR